MSPVAVTPIWTLCRESAAGILEDAQKLHVDEVLSPTPRATGFEGLPQAVLDTLRSRAQSTFKLFQDCTTVPGQEDASGRREELSLLTAEIETTYKRFYDFVYQDLPFCWRQLYTDLSILKFVLLWIDTLDTRKDGLVGVNENPEALDQMVAVLDKALILSGGAGIRRGRKTVEKMLSLLQEYLHAKYMADPKTDDRPPAKRQKGEIPFESAPSFSSRRIFNPPLNHPVKQFSSMTIDQFQTYMDKGHAAGGDGPLPIIIKGLTNDWPATTTRPWKKPSYLLSQTLEGRRLVPVEVGRSYVDDGWGQELITFHELLQRIEQSAAMSPAEQGQESHRAAEEAPKPLSYLAQHELFTQLPALRNDIPTPDLCYTSPPPHPLSPSLNKPELPLPLINAWLGPAGTITPLHTDGYHNLLAQVVGSKYVRLYSPRDSEALCPRGEDEDGIDMHNTSAYDVGVVEGWDAPPAGEEAQAEIELEEFRGLRYWEAVLEEGDVLYIPIGWWHYVRSLSVSFSVSFWWNGDHDTANDAG